MSQRIFYRISGDPTPGYNTILSEGSFMSPGESRLKHSSYASRETIATYIAIVGSTNTYYAIVMDPTKVRGEGSRAAALNVAIYIPNRHAIFNRAGVRVSPSMVLRDLQSQFIQRFMRDFGNNSYSYKSDETAIANIDSNNPLGNWLNDNYELQPIKTKLVTMTPGSPDIAYVSCSSIEQLDHLFLDLNYDELAAYSMLVAVDKGTDQTVQLIIPRPKTYKVEVEYTRNGVTVGRQTMDDISDLSKVCKTPLPSSLQPFEVARLFDFSISNGVIDKNNEGQKVKVDEENQRITVSVPIELKEYCIRFIPEDRNGKPLDEKIAEELLKLMTITVRGKIKPLDSWSLKVKGDELAKLKLDFHSDNYNLDFSNIHLKYDEIEKQIPLVFRERERRRVNFVIYPKGMPDDVWNAIRIVSNKSEKKIITDSGNHFAIFTDTEITSVWDFRLLSNDYELKNSVSFIPKNNDRVEINVKEIVKVPESDHYDDRYRPSDSSYDGYVDKSRNRKDLKPSQGNVPESPVVWKIKMPCQKDWTSCVVKFRLKDSGKARDGYPNILEFSVDLHHSVEQIKNQEILSGKFSLSAFLSGFYSFSSVSLTDSPDVYLQSKIIDNYDKSNGIIKVIEVHQNTDNEEKNTGSGSLLSNKWLRLSLFAVLLIGYTALCLWLGSAFLGKTVQSEKISNMTYVLWNKDEAQKAGENVFLTPTEEQQELTSKVIKALDQTFTAKDSITSGEIIKALLSITAIGDNSETPADIADQDANLSPKKDDTASNQNEPSVANPQKQDNTAAENAALEKEIDQTIIGLFNVDQNEIMGNPEYPEKVRTTLSSLSVRVSSSKLANKDKIVKGINFLYKDLNDATLKTRAMKAKGGLNTKGTIIEKLKDNRLGK